MINQPDLLLSHSADRLLLSGDGGLIIDPVGMTKGRQELLKHSLQLSLSLSVYLTLSLQVLMNFMEWSRRARTQSVCAALDCKRNAVYFPSDVNSVVCGCSHLYFTPSHQFSSIQPSNRRWVYFQRIQNQHSHLWKKKRTPTPNFSHWRNTHLQVFLAAALVQSQLHSDYVVIF